MKLETIKQDIKNYFKKYCIFEPNKILIDNKNNIIDLYFYQKNITGKNINQMLFNYVKDQELEKYCKFKCFYNSFYDSKKSSSYIVRIELYNY